MSEYRILNLYACLGGNRYKWDDVAKDNNLDIKVTAIELDTDIAKVYSERFPNDIVIVTDAHEYLLNNYKNFDFIWSSPPCPSHSRIRHSQKNRHSFTAIYPDLKLYEEVIFLENYFNGKYCVENVMPYYEPLIPAKKRGRHLYWTNYDLPKVLSNRKFDGTMCKTENEHEKLEKFHDIKVKNSLGGYRDVLRNLVDYEAGKTIFQHALYANIQNELTYD